jgi:hypothetical protein
MYSVLLHDKRLSGNTPDRSDTTGFTVEEGDPLDRVLGWVNACHRMKGQIEDLVIMCHGYVNPKNGKGGHGLQLSKDGVFLYNINKWTAIQGKVNWIFIYACNAADVDPTVSANEGDGRELCRRMAAMTGATVIAPVKTQEYDRSWNPLSWREIDFGGFQGPVYSFAPDGTVRKLGPLGGSDGFTPGTLRAAPLTADP